MILEVKALAVAISTVIAIASGTITVETRYAQKEYVDQTIAMNFDQMLEFRIRDIRVQINKIKVRAAAGKAWDDDAEEKVRLQKELDRLLEKKDM